jgi:hypothetical protein
MRFFRLRDEVNTIEKASKPMKPPNLQSGFHMKFFHGIIAILVIGLLSPVWSFGQTQQAQSQVMTTTTPSPDTEEAPKLPK